MRKRKMYYGIVGNGETALLIGPGLAIEWFCAPRFDSFPIFAGALDRKKGGSLAFSFNPPARFTRREYHYRTNILQTVLTGDELTVTVDDFMPWGKRCLVRIVSVENTGKAAICPSLKVQIEPVRTKAFPLKRQLQNGYYAVTGKGVAICVAGKEDFLTGMTEISLGRLGPGGKKQLRLVVTYGETEEKARGGLDSAFSESLEEAVRFWNDWLAKARKIDLADPELQEVYYRSLLLLKLLTYPKTGAIVAAPTASFPATPGGSDNWDYRYCWLRDGFYSATAFDDAGLHEEAGQFYEFAFALQHSDGSWPQPLYTVDGKHPKEIIISDLNGPNGEKPVRFGNKAARQLQLDNAGSVIHGLWHHYLATQDKSDISRYWGNIQRAADWVERHWQDPESGIWEIREYSSHWIYGKVLCYTCLADAAQIAEELGFKDFALRWRKVANAIKKEVVEKGWSPVKQAFVQHYGPAAPLDISVLALEQFDLLPATDPKITQTVDCIERPSACAVPDEIADKLSERNPGGLKLWGGIGRFEQAVLPFYLPTLWLAHHYLHLHQNEQAKKLLDICLDNMTDLYLMAEHFDPRTGEQWGNFPLALNHQELVRLLLKLAGQK
ncbi:MAG: glycoside hydrolase family 15 protein [Peptococcaceae bacterium]|nr:MAG: glycoside hydrolase family 15 protein [Peptococcaceae bacterium]